MAFLRTLFWIVMTVVVVIFSVHNWVPVTISLFGDLQADVKLPVLLVIAFLVGFVPLYVWYRLFKWRQERRFAAAGRPLAETSSISPPPPPAAASPDPFSVD